MATDAAGEGINLQFCWLMVNYDIPWNPARLEQRMGRIHRYGQTHDPVVVVNLVAGSNPRGERVLKTLLDKLETIRRQLQSGKVFDVIGRLFRGGVHERTTLSRPSLTMGIRPGGCPLGRNPYRRPGQGHSRDESAPCSVQGGEVERELDRLNNYGGPGSVPAVAPWLRSPVR